MEVAVAQPAPPGAEQDPKRNDSEPFPAVIDPSAILPAVSSLAPNDTRGVESAVAAAANSIRTSCLEGPQPQPGPTAPKGGLGIGAW